MRSFAAAAEHGARGILPMYRLHVAAHTACIVQLQHGAVLCLCVARLGPEQRGHARHHQGTPDAADAAARCTPSAAAPAPALAARARARASLHPGPAPLSGALLRWCTSCGPTASSWAHATAGSCCRRSGGGNEPRPRLDRAGRDGVPCRRALAPPRGCLQARFGLPAPGCPRRCLRGAWCGATGAGRGLIRGVWCGQAGGCRGMGTRCRACSSSRCDGCVRGVDPRTPRAR